jgi:hypothetical protein
MFRLPFLLIFLGLFVQSSLYVSGQEPSIFDIVKRGDVQNLKIYLDTTKTNINSVNAKGYSPLHVLIENYLEKRPDWEKIDAYKYQQSLKKYLLYRDCLNLLLEKGASTKQLTPEGWNALQYAVVKGKEDVINILLDKSGGGDVRDDEGNTLLHLSLLVKPDEPMRGFWERLVKKLSYYEINIETPNYAGQTPITFYMSRPRCIAEPEEPKPAGKLYGGSTTTSKKTLVCPTEEMNHMLDAFRDEITLETPDFSGRTAIDYSRLYNTWATWNLETYMETYRRIKAEGEERLKRFEEQAKENLRKIREYQARKAAEEAEEAEGKTKRTGCKNTCYACHGFGSGKEKAVRVECPVCYGRGNTGYSKTEIGGFIHDYTILTPKTCYKCNGRGKVTVYEQQDCHVCRGTGCLD